MLPKCKDEFMINSISNRLDIYSIFIYCPSFTISKFLILFILCAQVPYTLVLLSEWNEMQKIIEFLFGFPVNVHMPKDRVTQMHQGYGFVEFMGEEDADYAIKIMNMIKLYGKPIRVNKASAHQKNLDVGANIFIGNLDPEVDEKLLYDTFSAFGVILQTPKVCLSLHKLDLQKLLYQTIITI